MTTCNSVLASCICKKVEKHDGDHVCPCGGRWDEHYNPVEFPGGNPAFPFGQKWGEDDLRLLDE